MMKAFFLTQKHSSIQPCLFPCTIIQPECANIHRGSESSRLRRKCRAEELSSRNSESSEEFLSIKEDLKVGSPVVIIEAPLMLKTAEPMPMMRLNAGILKPGDAGRVIDRKPMNVWAVRFAAGAFLVDRKYFKPL